MPGLLIRAVFAPYAPLTSGTVSFIANNLMIVKVQLGGWLSVQVPVGILSVEEEDIALSTMENVGPLWDSIVNVVSLLEHGCWAIMLVVDTYSADDVNPL